MIQNLIDLFGSEMFYIEHKSKWFNVFNVWK